MLPCVPTLHARPALHGCHSWATLRCVMQQQGDFKADSMARRESRRAEVDAVLHCTLQNELAVDRHIHSAVPLAAPSPLQSCGIV